MTKFTKEKLIARIEKQIDINATIIERLGDDSAAVSELAVEVATMDIQILDFALAALAAPTEPVYQCEFCHHDSSGELQWHWEDVNKEFYEQYDPDRRGKRRVLYAAPQLPQPAVAENIALQNLRSAMEGIGHIRRTLEETFGGTYGTHVEPDVLVECKAICDAICAAYCGTAPQVTNVPDMAAVGEMPFLGTQEKAFVSGWNACRAAMLQGAEPVSQPDELPMDYLQGHKDGLEWSARLAESNHPQTGDWLYDDPLELAKAIRKGPDMPTGPVQGWIPCSERMPPRIPDTSTEYLVYETLNNMVQHDCWNVPEGNKSCQAFWNNYHDSVTHWQPLPAAPQQEA